MNIKQILKKVDFKKRDTQIILAFIVATLVSFGVIVYAGQTNALANEYYWAVKVGDSEAVAIAGKDKAKQVKDNFINTCLTKNSHVKSIECNPAITVEENILDEDSLAAKSDYAKDVQSGVAILLEDANDPDFINIKTREVVTAKESIPYETETVQDSSIPEGTSKVVTQGQYGIDEIQTEYVKENGKVVSQSRLSTNLTKAPVTEVVAEGTGDATADSEESSPGYSSLGQRVADYALQFVGNPYVYGGTSLTHGCDCSGFVMAVYNHFGIDLPHGAVSLQSCGTEVSESDAMPGDIVCYPAHCAIYIGNGKVVHAMDEDHGIVVTNIHYNTRVVTIRRIFT